MPTPQQLYDRDIAENGHSRDPSQTAAIEALNQLYLDITQGSLRPNSSLYLWGKVGRGKTYLMDCFYQALAGRAKRLHYYRFMQYLHLRLKHHQGNRDPLVLVAKDLLREHKILCLDEFFVSDIADAMLLGRLMTVLFQQGLVLVTTSNVEPSQLYKDGLQRDRFLPAIAMFERSLQIINLQGAEDHRLAKAAGFPHYYVDDRGCQQQSLDDSLLYQRFLSDSQGESIEKNIALSIESRQINCLAKSAGRYCFSFPQLFIGPRSANDYIALGEIVEFIYLLDVPQMGGQLNERKVARGTEDTYNINQKVADRPFILAKGDDEARRFISFIDEMYDQNKRVIIGAHCELAKLYLGGRVVFEFERTYSRIIEMQASTYLKSKSAV